MSQGSASEEDEVFGGYDVPDLEFDSLDESYTAPHSPENRASQKNKNGSDSVDSDDRRAEEEAVVLAETHIHSMPVKDEGEKNAQHESQKMRQTSSVLSTVLVSDDEEEEEESAISRQASSSGSGERSILRQKLKELASIGSAPNITTISGTGEEDVFSRVQKQRLERQRKAAEALRQYEQPDSIMELSTAAQAVEPVAINDSTDRLVTVIFRLSEQEKVIVKLKETRPVVSAKAAIGARLGLRPDALKLVFDGDSLKAEDTPSSLDLEDEDIVDVALTMPREKATAPKSGPPPQKASSNRKTNDGGGSNPVGQESSNEERNSKRAKLTKSAAMATNVPNDTQSAGASAPATSSASQKSSSKAQEEIQVKIDSMGRTQRFKCSETTTVKSCTKSLRHVLSRAGISGDPVLLFNNRVVANDQRVLALGDGEWSCEVRGTGASVSDSAASSSAASNRNTSQQSEVIATPRANEGCFRPNIPSELQATVSTDSKRVHVHLPGGKVLHFVCPSSSLLLDVLLTGCTGGGLKVGRYTLKEVVRPDLSLRTPLSDPIVPECFTIVLTARRRQDKEVVKVTVEKTSIYLNMPLSKTIGELIEAAKVVMGISDQSFRAETGNHVAVQADDEILQTGNLSFILKPLAT